jgi:hypothetical protein
MKAKIRASLIHFGLSMCVAIAVLSLVYLGWYRGVLSTTEGVGMILVIMLGIDVVLGPLMTLIVYKTGKPSLKFDLFVIGLLQLGFLAYGLHTVQLGRPAFIVFSKDRFETVSVADWSEEAREDLARTPNPFADKAFDGPKLVTVLPPINGAEREKLMFEAVKGGPDLPQLPKYYQSFDKNKAAVMAKAVPIEALIAFNKGQAAEVEGVVKGLRKYANRVGFLPLKGRERDAVVFVNLDTGDVLSYALFNPWTQ